MISQGNTMAAKTNISPVRRVFLLGVVLFLPLLFLDHVLSDYLQQRVASELEEVEKRLVRQSSKARTMATDQEEIKEFCSDLVRRGFIAWPDAKLKSYLDDLERKYPRAFRWLFWDDVGKIRQLDYSAKVVGSRVWAPVIPYLLKLAPETSDFSSSFNYSDDPQILGAFAMAQKALGRATRLPHVLDARFSPMKVAWMGKPCFLSWDVDVVSYTQERRPDKTRGGFLLQVFPEELPEQFWQKRFIRRRHLYSGRGLSHPMALVNLSPGKPGYLGDELRGLVNLKALRRALHQQSRECFIFGGWLVRSASVEPESPYRLLTLAPIRSIYTRQTSLLWQIRRLMCGSLLLGLFFLLFLGNRKRFDISLQWRITGFFLLAVLIPLAALVSIGGTYLVKEEERLRSQAYLEMRQHLKALDLRYQMQPRLVEGRLFQELEQLLNQNTDSFDTAEKAVQEALRRDLIESYYLGNGNTIERSNMTGKDAMSNMLKIASFIARRMSAVEEKIQASKALIQDFIDEEAEEILLAEDIFSGLSRPSHLSYYQIRSHHLFMMLMQLVVDGQNVVLIVQVPARHLEATFATQEFLANSAAQENSEHGAQGCEILFFSRGSHEHLPPGKMSLWRDLKQEFERSFNLRTEESGEIAIDGENFLYLLQPLPSMHEHTYVPCFLFSTRIIEARVRNIRVNLAAGVISALLLAVLIGFILSSSLLNPIQELDFAIQRVSAGDLAINLPVVGSDELGRLRRSLNVMIQGLRERERLTAYVSDVVLEAVQTEDAVEVASGQHIQATILFSDIRNFTGLSEQHTPPDIFFMLNEFLGTMEPIIRRGGGRVDKFIGDAIMAVFPGSRQNHALRAVVVALGMITAINDKNRERQAAGKFPIKIGIGINTGLVLLGNVGSENRKDLTVIGDAVNLASRLESASKQAKHSSIIVSETTYDLIREDVEVVEMKPRKIRGKSQLVRMFEVLGRKDSSPLLDFERDQEQD